MPNDRRYLKLSSGLHTHEHTCRHTKKEESKRTRGKKGEMGKEGERKRWRKRRRTGKNDSEV